MPPARLLLPVLLLLSGFCGISYEILYTKLLGNLLGNQFAINATVLLTFLLGIGFGTLYAHRFRNLLWAVEGGIGLYAVLLVAAYDRIDVTLYESLPGLGTSVLACTMVAFGLLLVPAFLIGCSLPLFASYLGSLRSSNVFSITYALYNVGAAVTALGMEFVLLRSVGLRAATLILASLNAVVALGVLALVRRESIVTPAPPERRRFPARVVGALALASVASAIFQLLMIKVAEFIFGPYNETFSLVLATVLLGLALGAAASARLGLTFGGALLLALGGLAWVLGGLAEAATLYARLHPWAAQSYPGLVALKLGLVFVLMGAPAVGFGATIPALLRTHRDVARESGQLLFVSSLANALGFLLMAFVLHRYLDYGPILVLLAGLTAGAVLLHDGWRLVRARSALAMAALSALAWTGLWDEQLLYIGHTNFQASSHLHAERQQRFLAERWKGAQDVFAITWRDGEPYFFINGYVSIPLRSASEKIVGAVSSMLAPRTDRALVLGVGSGTTAATVGLVFDETDAVEINRVVLDNLHRMAEYNFDIESRANVNIVHDDGVHYVKTSPKHYSLILNTVTTPLYFSSSKLYTRDFLEQVQRRLMPDGIYVTWMDHRIGDRGIDIILETLAGVFDHCWIGFVQGSYNLLTCSDQEIRLRQFERVTGHPELRRSFQRDHALALRMVPYGVISIDGLGLRAPTGHTPVNTLDFPVLEFEMARLQASAGIDRFWARMRQHIRWRPLQAELGRSMRWSQAEFVLWADLQDTIEFRISQPAEYDRAALAVAAELGSAAAFRRSGDALAERGRTEAARQAFAEARRIDPAHAEPAPTRRAAPEEP